ncbi:MAG: hypothetical protein GXY85_10910 [Candidatus Brocadiaceae bacterium]|nr:hypothetical protein [Candidatus Brocadiaceae bacterium]
MARQTVIRGTVSLRCVCGRTVEFEQGLLGRVFRCPHCGRLLRPALQFLLIDRRMAPNLTAQCACGHFVVEERGRVGARVRCTACGAQLIMPQPTVSFGAAPVARVPRKALQERMKRSARPHERVPPNVERLTAPVPPVASTLRPGETVCVNPECGALLTPRAIVCSRCGTNRFTGQRYTGPGPAGDPRGRWLPV